jgi:hypothetical protein
MKEKDATIIANKYLKQLDEESNLSRTIPHYNFVKRLFRTVLSWFKDDSVYSFLIDKKTTLVYPIDISLVNEVFRSEIDKTYDTFIKHLNNSFPPSQGVDVKQF